MGSLLCCAAFHAGCLQLALNLGLTSALACDGTSLDPRAQPVELSGQVGLPTAASCPTPHPKPQVPG